MNGKSCFFIGHREASSELLPLLNEAIEAHITQYGVTNFIAGHYGGFDQLAAKAVIAAKKCHPKITLSLLLPYHPAERSIKLPAGFDDMIYPDGLETVPRKYAIVRANRHIIEHVDYLISYVWHPASNARNLLEFAQRRATNGLIQITNLASPHPSFRE